MINSFYQSLQTALNHNLRGKITPSEFNALLHEGMKELYVSLFAEFRKSNYRSMRMQSTPNYGDEAFNMKQAIEYYVDEQPLTVQDAFALLPADVFFVNAIFNEETEYEKVDALQFKKLNRSTRMKPTKCNPVYTLMNGGVRLSPAPGADTQVGNERPTVTLIHYRKIKPPKWTYRIIQGRELFDPDKSDFQDIDMHPLMLPKLFNKVLHLAGLNLQEPEVAQYIAQVKQEEAMQQNG